MIQSVSLYYSLYHFIFVSKLVHQINLNYTISVGSAILGTGTLVLLRKKKEYQIILVQLSLHLMAACKVIITLRITILVQGKNIVNNHDYLYNYYI